MRIRIWDPTPFLHWIRDLGWKNPYPGLTFWIRNIASERPLPEISSLIDWLNLPNQIINFLLHFRFTTVVNQAHTRRYRYKDFYYSQYQCCGSRRMFLGLLDPDPLVRCTDPDPSIIKQNIKNNLDSYCFVTSSLLFIFEKWCKYTWLLRKVLSRTKIRYLVKVVNRTRIGFLASWRSVTKISGCGSICQRHDPRIRIYTKMSRIRNTAPYFCSNAFKLIFSTFYIFECKSPVQTTNSYSSGSHLVGQF